MHHKWHGRTESRSKSKKLSLPARAATRRVSPLALRPARKNSSRSRHGRMRKCRRMSKAAMKAKRSHAEISVQYERPDAQKIYTHTVFIKGTTLRKGDVIALIPPIRFHKWIGSISIECRGRGKLSMLLSPPMGLSLASRAWATCL
jgi:hypothetical protein